MKPLTLFLLLPLCSLLFFQCSDNAPSPSGNKFIVTYPNGTNKTIPLVTTEYINNADWYASISGTASNKIDYVSLYYGASESLQNYNGNVNAPSFIGQLTVFYNDTLWSPVSGNITVKYHSQFLSSPETTTITFSNMEFSNSPANTQSRVMSCNLYAIKP